MNSYFTSDRRDWKSQSYPAISTVMLAVALLAAGCTAPISARRESTSRAYNAMTASALDSDKLSSSSRAVLQRYDLISKFGSEPDAALRALHERACTDPRRDVLFALAEANYLHAHRVEKDLRAWAPKNARDYYLASAIYAYFYLFSEGAELPPGALDPRGHLAADLYDRAVGKGLAPARSTNRVVVLEGGNRELLPGRVNLAMTQSNPPVSFELFDRWLPADDFVVRGLTVRN